MLNLYKVHAREVMVTEVVQLHTLTPLEAAIETLQEYSIHGAPVVDEGGDLVGVLSLMDVVRRDEEVESAKSSGRPAYYAYDSLDEEREFFSREEYAPDVLGRELVSDWMHERVISVDPATSLADVCCLMVKERIHRVFVVDGAKLLGVISTFDVVRRIASEVSLGTT